MKRSMNDDFLVFFIYLFLKCVGNDFLNDESLLKICN